MQFPIQLGGVASQQRLAKNLQPLQLGLEALDAIHVRQRSLAFQGGERRGEEQAERCNEQNDQRSVPLDDVEQDPSPDPTVLPRSAGYSIDLRGQIQRLPEKRLSNDPTCVHVLEEL